MEGVDFKEGGIMAECSECKRELGKYYTVHYAGAMLKVCSLPCVLTALTVPFGKLTPEQTPFRVDVQMCDGFVVQRDTRYDRESVSSGDKAPGSTERIH